MTTVESSSSMPDLPIRPELVKQLSPEQSRGLIEQVSVRLQALGESSVRTSDHHQEERAYLKGKLAESKGGRGPGGQKVNLNDPDDLWIIANILYPKETAGKIYSIARLAQIKAAGRPAPNPEEMGKNWQEIGALIHKEMLSSYTTLLEELNDRQLLAGEGAVLKLLAEEMTAVSSTVESLTGSGEQPSPVPAVPERAEEQSQLPAKQKGGITSLPGRIWRGFLAGHNPPKSPPSSGIPRDELNLARPETGSEASEAVKQWQEMFHSQAEHLRVSSYMAGGFMLMDGQEIRLPDGEIRRIPDVFDRVPDQVEMTGRLSGVGHYMFNPEDNTMSVVGPDGSLWIGSLTGENTRALQDKGYTEGKIVSILRTGWSFATPSQQEAYTLRRTKAATELLIEYPDEPGAGLSRALVESAWVEWLGHTQQELEERVSHGPTAGEVWKQIAQEVSEYVQFQAGRSSSTPAAGSSPTDKPSGEDKLEGSFQDVERFLSTQTPEMAENIRKIAADTRLAGEARLLGEEMESHLQQLKTDNPPTGEAEAASEKTPEQLINEAENQFYNSLSKDPQHREKAIDEIARVLEGLKPLEVVNHLLDLRDSARDQVRTALLRSPQGQMINDIYEEGKKVVDGYADAPGEFPVRPTREQLEDDYREARSEYPEEEGE